jgi:uncharacterized membrane protein
MTDPHPTHRRGFLASLRASFLTGLVVVLPIGLTIYFVWAVIGWIDGWILPLIPASYQPNALIAWMLGPEYEFPVRGVGVLVFLFVTILVGWMAKGLIGRSVIRSGEDLVSRMPVVRSVYGAIKQVAETFFDKKEKSFDKVVLVEFPRPGSWALGFLSTRPKGELAERLAALGPDMSAVFVGLTPFTSGMLLFVPTKDLVLWKWGSMTRPSLSSRAVWSIPCPRMSPLPRDPA